MSYSIVAHTAGVASTTSAIDTTGADLIIVVAAYDSGATFSDSKSNSWSGLTVSGPATGAASFCRIYYKQAPTVGSGHTFTLSIAYGAVAVIALSGSQTTPFDQEAGNVTAGATSLQPGSVTPGVDNEIIIAGLCQGTNGNTVLIDAGFTVLDQVAAVNASHYGVALAYLIQTTAGAVNPTFSWTSVAADAARNATFKSAAAGGLPFFMQQDLLSGQFQTLNGGFQ